MPVHCPISFRHLTKQDFRALDYRVMQAVFATHNELGRLCDEEIYERDLQARLQAGGILAGIEIPVDVSFADFHKRYFLDLVVEDGLLYELKTATAFVGDHDAQVLNYLLLLGLQTGKLVNFRPASVEWKFVNTRLTHYLRRELTVDRSRWHEIASSCVRLREIMVELLSDWGAFLDLGLYEEALVHFLGGEQHVISRVPLIRQALTLGFQRSLLLTSDVAFRLTAFKEDITNAETHLRRFLDHTRLRAIQWINLAHAQIQFITLTK